MGGLSDPGGPATPSPEAPRAPEWWGWLVVAAVVAVELATFTTYARREIVWAYPGGYDQANYLTSSYAITRDLGSHDLARAVGRHFRRPQATGVLLPVQGAVHQLVLGQGRLGALSVNFLHLVLFQCVFVATLRWASRDWWVALTGLGLTLALKAPFLPAGGAFDFRIDFASFCLFGVSLCALIRSRLLLCPRWSLAFGLAAGVLVLFRFLTSVYLAGLGGLILAGITARWLFAGPEGRGAAVARLRGWALASAALLAVAAPALVAQRKSIVAYYVVGHVTSSEKDIRAVEFAVAEWSDAALYYPRSLARDHAGPAFWWLTGVVAAAGALGLACRGASAQPDDAPARRLRRVLPAAALGFAVPYLILNAHAMKSPAVGIVLLPGLLWLVLAPLVAGAAGGRPRWHLRAAGLAALLGGALAQLDYAAAPSLYTGAGDELAPAARLADGVADYCERKGLGAPELFVDANTQEFFAPALSVAEFEKRGRWRDYRDGGTTIFAGEEAEHFERLRRADVAILCGKGEGHFRYPYDLMLEKMRPRVQAYCDANLIKIGEYRLGGRTVAAYGRGHLRVEGATSDGWVTADGVRLTGTLADLAHCRAAELRRAGANYLGLAPGARAEVEVGGRPPRPLAVAVAPDLASVRVAWEPVDLPADTPVTIRVHFDNSFVPKERGMGTDPRRLVMCLGERPRTWLIQKADGTAP